jgi:hypothetical protein
MLPPGDFLRLAVEPTRLAILGHAAVGSLDVSGLAASLGVSERDVLRTAGSLRKAGLLTEELTLDTDRLAEIARSLPDLEPAAPEMLEGAWSPEELDVLSRFFEGSRLREIPAARGKRRVVLERIAQEFEPGVRYDERRVSSMLQVFHPDYAALRRYLVDEGFLTRAEGVYWRTGGRFDPV